MKAAPRASLSELFLGISSLLSTKKKPVAVATVSFTMLLAVGAAALQFKTQHIEDQLMGEFSMTEEVFMTTLDTQINGLSEMEFPQFVQATGYHFGPNPVHDAPAEEYKLGLRYLRRTLPFVLARIVFDIVVMFVAGVFFLLLFTAGAQSAYESARRLPGAVISMISLMFWMLLRSLIWIPIIGPAIALYMLPRLALAPIFLASGEAGIRESVQLSMKRTSGHWASVFVKLLLIGLTSLLILWPLLVLVVATSLFSVKIGYILLLLSAIFIIAYQCAGLTVLAVMMA